MRSFLFSIIFYLWITIAMVACLPFIFFYPVIYGLNSWFAKSLIWLLKVVVGCESRFEGLDNLPVGKIGHEVPEGCEQAGGHHNLPLNSSHSALATKKGFVIASKHQSAWETFVAFAVLPKVCFVYKKELGYIPIYGWYNRAYRNIKVDRGAGAKAIKSVLKGVKDRVYKGHQVIIFPQGTRTPFGVDAPYKSSVYAMYKEGVDVYPAALNADNCWPKKGAKKAGTITWKFYPKMPDGLSKDEFMSQLQVIIESGSNDLNG